MGNESRFDYKRGEREASHTSVQSSRPSAYCFFLVIPILLWLMARGHCGSFNTFNITIAVKINISGTKWFQSWFSSDFGQVTFSVLPVGKRAVIVHKVSGRPICMDTCPLMHNSCSHVELLFLFSKGLFGFRTLTCTLLPHFIIPTGTAIVSIQSRAIVCSGSYNKPSQTGGL